MQTLILKNETLKKEIDELENKIQKIEEGRTNPQQNANINKTKSKSLFGTLVKKSALNIFDEGKDNRSAKQVEAIRTLHELLLSNKYEQAETFIQEKKKVLFGKSKKSGAQPRPLDLVDEYGESALMKAVKQGKLTTVEELLELGASADVADSDGETPLMTAAKYGQLPIVKVLLEKANRDAKTKYSKKTALHFASQYGHIEVCKALLSNGVDSTIEDIDGNTALKLAKDKETFKAIKSLLKKTSNATGENSEDEDNEELAFVTGNEEYDPFKIIKKERSYSNDEQMKPLMEENKALEAQKQNLMIRLEDLKNKRLPKDTFDMLKSLDAATRRKFLGMDNTPKDKLVEKYHSLVLQGDQPGALEDVEKLLTTKNKKAKALVDKDAPDEFGETAVMKAARLGYLAMLNLLILYKCQLDVTDFDGYTAVMKAAQFGKLECLERLIEEGAELDLTTRTGKMTALMLAAQRGHGKVARALIQEGANHQLMDTSGKRAVDMATNEDAKNMIEEAMMEHPMMQNNVQI